VLACGGWSATGRAAEPVPQEGKPRRKVVHVEPPDDSQDPAAARALEEPAFVTTVDLEARRAEAPTAAKILGEQVGVTVRTYGGMGAFTSVAVRGASAGQTEILVDGVPLSRLVFSSVDLGTFDLGTFDEVDIYRSGAPVALSGAALGGAITLNTTAGPLAGAAPTTFQLGLGSWGARRALALRRDRWGAWRTTFALGASAARGDYQVFDDNGTTLQPADDGARARSNNGFRQLDGVGRAAWQRGELELRFGVRGGLKTQGVPGPVGIDAQHTSLCTDRLIGDVTLIRGRGEHGDLAVNGGAWLVLERQHWRDPEGEVGLANQNSVIDTVAIGGHVTAEIVPRGLDRFELSLEPRLEQVSIDDSLAMVPHASGRRLGGALAAGYQLMLAGGRLALVASARVELSDTRADAGAGEQAGEPAPGPRTDLFAVPRLAGRWRPVPWLAFKASVGRYLREPTLVELYGDRGVVVGNPGLLPEVGWSGDVGLVLAPGAVGPMLDRLSVESALFAAAPHDLVTWMPTAAHTAVAQNLADARLWGLELALGARAWRSLSLHANYTYLDSRQSTALVSFDGKRLPGRPRHELYARLDLDLPMGALRLGLHADTTLQEDLAIDAANINIAPTRTWLGAGAHLVWRDLRVDLSVDNLGDLRVDHLPLDPSPRPGLTSTPRAVADVLGYPLPGRSFLVTVTANL
jgi:iron complex outermembrane receptor protein